MTVRVSDNEGKATDETTIVRVTGAGARRVRRRQHGHARGWWTAAAAAAGAAVRASGWSGSRAARRDGSRA